MTFIYKSFNRIGKYCIERSTNAEIRIGLLGFKKENMLKVIYQIL